MKVGFLEIKLSMKENTLVILNEGVLIILEIVSEREENVPTPPKHHTMPPLDIGALRQVSIINSYLIKVEDKVL